MLDKEFLEFYQGYLYCGVDEVGRGPLAGDVVTASVILDPNNPIEGLNDSKKLTEKKREKLFPEIQEKALAWSISRCSIAEIDELNILHASLTAMTRAVNGLSITPEFVFVDGNKLPKDLTLPATAVVKGDSRIDAIAAASILAKVTRDREMVAADKEYPEYGFAKHKGYPTKVHMQALLDHGVTPLHRKTFAPVRRIIEGK
jgi:ribonuclease HII